MSEQKMRLLEQQQRRMYVNAFGQKLIQHTRNIVLDYLFSVPLKPFPFNRELINYSIPNKIDWSMFSDDNNVEYWMHQQFKNTLKYNLNNLPELIDYLLSVPLAHMIKLRTSCADNILDALPTLIGIMNGVSESDEFDEFHDLPDLIPV